MTELTDKAPCYEIANQTDFVIDQVQTPWSMPSVMGVSKKTLVEDNELFIFNDEVEPILSVLCGKTLECARMEVLEEEELKEMAKQQDQFRQLSEMEQSDIRKMEEEEINRLEAHEIKKGLERTRRVTRFQSHQKICSRTIAKQYLANVKGDCFTLLKDTSFFYDRRVEEGLKCNVLPWLFS